MGFVHYNNSEFDIAKDYLLRGEKDFFSKEDNPKQFAINQTYTALILIVEKDFEAALYHLKKAEYYANKSANNFINATVYQNLGLVHIEMDKLEKGGKYFEKAIKTGNLDSINIGYIYQNLAFLYLKKGEDEKIDEYINKTLNIWNELEFQKGVYLLSFIEAKQAISQEKYEEALAFIENGRASYSEENKLLIGENYLLEAKIHEKIGNSDAQLAALENAILKGNDLTKEQLNDAIINLSNQQEDSKTNLLLANLVAKLKEQNINQNKINIARSKIMDSEIAEEVSTIKTQNYYLFILCLLSISMMYLFFRLRNQKLDIEELNENLESSKKVIEDKVETLKQKNKELEQFAYVASHDLKSPLRNISSFAGLLKRKESCSINTEYLDIIIDSTKNMSTMISELLDFSIIDQNLKFKQRNLYSLVQNSLSSINSQILESNATIEISENCNQEIYCDEALLSTVFQNLVSNAIIYCKEDADPNIKITATSNNNQTKINVSDNGIGIAQAYQDQVFEMFKRLNTKKVEGTGIGLASCKKIIEQHGGTISIDSRLGEGSTFTITPVSYTHLTLPTKRIV